MLKFVTEMGRCFKRLNFKNLVKSARKLENTFFGYWIYLWKIFFFTWCNWSNQIKLLVISLMKYEQSRLTRMEFAI